MKSPKLIYKCSYTSAAKISDQSIKDKLMLSTKIFTFSIVLSKIKNFYEYVRSEAPKNFDQNILRSFSQRSNNIFILGRRRFISILEARTPPRSRRMQNLEIKYSFIARNKQSSWNLKCINYNNKIVLFPHPPPPYFTPFFAPSRRLGVWYI